MTTATILADNGVSSGSSGLKTSGGNDGTLVLQTTTSGGTATTAVTIDTSQNTTMAGYLNAPNTFGFKNRIINGAMMIDQRNAGASVTVNAASSFFSVDRFSCYGQATDGVFTIQQTPSATETGYATRVAAGFTNYLAATTTTADSSIGSTQIYLIRHRIEGVNVADLAWGTANAKPVTLSFLVRSSLTGTFGGSLRNDAQDRSYPFSYTISEANTWEQKTITIAGDTSGTWLTNTSTGIGLAWSLGSGSSVKGTTGAWTSGNYTSATGSVDPISTLNATFYITGVQLEKGSTATSFDYRPYGTELALCQRYCYVPLQGALTNAAAFSSTRFDAFLPFPVTMRATPAGAYASGSTYYRVYLGGISSSFSTLLTNGINANGVLLYSTSISGVSTGAGGWLETQSAPYGAIVFSAEL